MSVSLHYTITTPIGTRDAPEEEEEDTKVKNTHLTIVHLPLETIKL